jgi:hypothetical protein
LISKGWTFIDRKQHMNDMIMHLSSLVYGGHFQFIPNGVQKNVRQNLSKYVYKIYFNINRLFIKNLK